MEAGRELDALVAEKVMGWHRETDTTYDYNNIQHGSEILLPPNITLDRLLAHGFVLPPKGEIPLAHFVSDDYSTDIVAAWKIAHWVRNRNGHFQVECDFGGRWMAIITLPLSKDDPRRDGIVGAWGYRGESDTAPHAICLAALRAVGVEV